MAAQITLRPSDIVVACELTISLAPQFAALAHATGLSTGECHNAVRRLRLAGLVLPNERRISAELLWSFLVEGVPYAFPAMRGAPTIGVPTAHSAPAFRGVVESSETFVWPHPDGTLRGQSIVPLFPQAPNLPASNAPLYELLTIVDAIRTGSARIRKLAAALLSDRLKSQTT